MIFYKLIIQFLKKLGSILGHFGNVFFQNISGRTDPESGFWRWTWTKENVIGFIFNLNSWRRREPSKNKTREGISLLNLKFKICEL
jgi:hypothetical protein